MKRKTFITLFILLIAVLLLSTTVFADMDAPSVKRYKATVSNIDGAPQYSFEYDEDTDSETVFEKVFGSMEDD